MPTRERWLLPPGIEELLPPAAEEVERLRRQLLDLFRVWGYELVMPPFLEYVDSLLTGTGADLELETFKVTDQETGRLMGLRADMTPQAARIDAHALRERRGAVRLCYIGTVLHARRDRLGGSRSPVQVGAELYGHRGTESDLEVLLLMLETLSAAGVQDVVLGLGHAGLFRTLLGESASGSQVDASVEARLFDALQRKAADEILAIGAEANLDTGVAEGLAAMTRLHGGAEVLQRARRVLDPGSSRPGVQAALHTLADIGEGLERSGASVPVQFDLAELPGYRYHQGIVFGAYAPGWGREVARGGRYDNVGEAFGRARPATGFSTDLKVLHALGEAQRPPRARRGILAPWGEDEGLRGSIAALRKAGERVVQLLPGDVSAPGELGCDRRLVPDGAGGWQIVEIEA